MNAGQYVGYGLATLLILSVKSFGWRQSYVLLGLSAVVMAVVSFLVIKEPERGYQIRLETEAKLR